MSVRNENQITEYLKHITECLLQINAEQINQKVQLEHLCSEFQVFKQEVISKLSAIQESITSSSFVSLKRARKSAVANGNYDSKQKN